MPFWRLSWLAFWLEMRMFWRATQARKEGLFGFLKFAMVLVGFWLYGWSSRTIIGFYAYWRWIDDIVDGDIKLPRGYASVTAYLKEREQFFDLVVEKVDSFKEIGIEELFLVHAFRQANRNGLTIVHWFKDMWTVFSFDFHRRSFEMTVPQEQLIEMASLQDCAIVSMFSSIFAERSDNPVVLQVQDDMRKLNGLFTRSDWLTVLLADLRQGIITVPKEAGIPGLILLCCNSWDELFAIPGFESWFSEEYQSVAELWQKCHNTFYNNYLHLLATNIGKGWPLLGPLFARAGLFLYKYKYRKNAEVFHELKKLQRSNSVNA